MYAPPPSPSLLVFTHSKIWKTFNSGVNIYCGLFESLWHCFLPGALHRLVSSQVAHGSKPISLLVRVSVTKYVESPRVPLSVMDA